MPGPNLFLRITKGEILSISGTHRASGAVGAAVVDITGWTISGFIRRRLDTADPVLLTVTFSVVSGPLGTYTGLITRAQAITLGRGQFYMGIFRTNTGSETSMGLAKIDIELGGWVL